MLFWKLTKCWGQFFLLSSLVWFFQLSFKADRFDGCQKGWLSIYFSASWIGLRSSCGSPFLIYAYSRQHAHSTMGWLGHNYSHIPKKNLYFETFSVLSRRRYFWVPWSLSNYRALTVNEDGWHFYRKNHHYVRHIRWFKGIYQAGGWRLHKAGVKPLCKSVMSLHICSDLLLHLTALNHCFNGSRCFYSCQPYPFLSLLSSHYSSLRRQSHRCKYNSKIAISVNDRVVAYST